jgi:regulator of protease activity HflC (stomatin/prohibitin superfamily)
VVHIKRVNYIESVRSAVYDRMKSERIRIAKLFESEAEEEKNRILGLTTKELDAIRGEQEQRAAEIRGRANAEVTKIAAEAYGKSPEFYGFIRHLEAYKKTLGGGTRLILSTDNNLLQHLRGKMTDDEETAARTVRSQDTASPPATAMDLGGQPPGVSHDAPTAQQTPAGSLDAPKNPEFP